MPDTAVACVFVKSKEKEEGKVYQWPSALKNAKETKSIFYNFLWVPYDKPKLFIQSLCMEDYSPR